MLALQRAQHHQQQQQQQLQQARSDGTAGVMPAAKLGSGERSTPSIMELDRQIPSSDSGQNRNSPVNSTAAGSSLQVRRWRS